MNTMSTASTKELLAERFSQLQHANKLNINNGEASSIENTVGNTTDNTSIELPPENSVNQALPQAITELITGNDYWVLAKSNRYKKLIREGHLEKLLELAKMAHSKDNPANWFAKACSKAAWGRTLDYFAKLQTVAQKAEHVARRIGTKVNKFIYKQIWKGINVERWAVQAEEMQHKKPGQSREKHFAWLCMHEKTLLQ
jgi:hypothetical protein